MKTLIQTYKDFKRLPIRAKYHIYCGLNTPSKADTEKLKEYDLSQYNLKRLKAISKCCC